MGLIKACTSQLLVIDIQQKLAPHIHQTEVLTQNARHLMQAAISLEIPVTVTEHYPEGLGPSVEALQDLIPKCRVFEKIHFSAAHEPEILERLKSDGRDNVIVLGSEAHVCVMQTALGLLDAGFNVWIVDDASSSRKAFDRTTALKRMNADGVHSLSTEMLLFEWLERGDSPAFKQTLKMIKEVDLHWVDT